MSSLERVLDFSISPAYVNPEERLIPPRKLAFLVENNYTSLIKSSLLGRSEFEEFKELAELNHASTFDCFHFFDSIHISTFLSTLPETIQKRVCLYIIRYFARFKKVEEIVETILKPAFEQLINSQPSWLKDFGNESLLATLVLIQSELGSHEKMEEEYNLIIKHLEESSNQLSAASFIKYLEENQDITEVYALVETIHINFLDSFCHIAIPEEDQRHLSIQVKDRQIPIHLFGRTYINHYARIMQRYAHEHELKVPHDHFNHPNSKSRKEHLIVRRSLSEKKLETIAWTSVWTDNGLPLNSQLEKAVEEFDFWMNSYNFMKGEDHVDLVDWLFCTQGERLIYDFHSYERLAVQANAWGHICNHKNPDRTLYQKDRSIFSARLLSNKIRSVRNKREPVYQLGRSNLRNPFSAVPADNGRTILSFFPASPGPLKSTKLPELLKKYIELIKIARQAMAKFENSETFAFDPLVGDRSCQIRISMFAEILKKNGIKDQIRKVERNLEEHEEHIRGLLADLPVKAFYVDSFRTYLMQYNASLEISEDVAVIISSYILTEAKLMGFIEDRHEGISKKLLKDRNGITANFAQALIRISQIKLAEMSVLYVQRLALGMLLKQEERVASKLVFEQVKVDDKCRKLVPFYPAMRLLLQEMHRNEIPIVLRIEQFLKGQSESYGIFSMVFCNFGKGEYQLHHYPTQLLHKMAVVFHSISVTEEEQSKKAIEEKVLEHKITNLILSASAAHPQYTCNHESFPSEEPSYQKYLALAYKVGVWRGNPCLFDIKHLSYSTINEKIL